MDRAGAAGKLSTGVSVEYRYWIKCWCWRWKPAQSELVYLGWKAEVYCYTTTLGPLLPRSLFGSLSTFSCSWRFFTNKIFRKCFHKQIQHSRRATIKTVMRTMPGAKRIQMNRITFPTYCEFRKMCPFPLESKHVYTHGCGLFGSLMNPGSCVRNCTSTTQPPVPPPACL